MKYLKKFEYNNITSFVSQRIKERVLKYNDIKFNIESLLMDLTDQGCTLQFKNSRKNGESLFTIDININKRRNKDFYDNLVNYILSVNDLMDTENYKYNKLTVILGFGYRRIQCKIVDGRFKRYPLKDNTYLRPEDISNIEIDFIRK